MSNLFGSLHLAGRSLNAYSKAMTVTQNNLTNAATPGYARQTPILQALPYHPGGGMMGGIEMISVGNSRREFAEAGVRNGTSLVGYDQQMSHQLDTMMPWFNPMDVEESVGLAGSFDDWYEAVRKWSSSPQDIITRQELVDRADGLTTSFRETVGAVEQARTQARAELESSVADINRLLGSLESMQKGLVSTSGPDAGVESTFYATMEELAEHLDIRVTKDSSGSTSISTANGALLLNREQAWPLTLSYEPPPAGSTHPTAASTPRVTAADGTELTSANTSGKVGALLEGLTNIFPSLLGDADEPGDLNRLAQQFADQVNEIFSTAQLSETDPTPGIPLFEYDTSDPLAVARTLAVNPDVDDSTLALASTLPTLDPTGVPAQLFGMRTDTSPPGGVQPEGSTYTGFFAGIGLELGSVREQAGKSENFHSQMLGQARAIRERVSGVSLAEESVALIQLQRSFESIARVVSVIDEMIQTTINLGR
jgi:flagellar hook-associated protein 1